MSSALGSRSAQVQPSQPIAGCCFHVVNHDSLLSLLPEGMGRRAALLREHRKLLLLKTFVGSRQDLLLGQA